MPINPWLEEQLQKKGGSPLSVILEVPNSKKGYATNIISSIGTIISTSDIAGTSYITINIDSSKLQTLSEIGLVHYNMPKSIGLCKSCSKKPLPVTKQDKYLGNIGIDKIESPTSPDRFIQDSSNINPNDYIFVPTSKTIEAIKDTAQSTQITGRNVKVAIIDTGYLPPVHPQNFFRPASLYSVVNTELPTDYHSHGSWVSLTVFGIPFNHPTYGRVEGMAQNATQTHVKALDWLGMGDSSGLIKAIEIAYNNNNKVISMSIGGESQGGVMEDPESRLISTLSEKGIIFVIAAGNEGKDWSIQSPGVCPGAITVGSMSYTDQDISWFSSRGEQSSWYQTHQTEYNNDYDVYGENLIKPDVISYGGGRKIKNDKDEVLFNGGVGWLAPYYHKKLDGFAAMHGTSQAVPHVTGVIACLLEKGLINNSSDFKLLLKNSTTESKNGIYGYGKLNFSRLMGG